MRSEEGQGDGERVSDGGDVSDCLVGGRGKGNDGRVFERLRALRGLNIELECFCIVRRIACFLRRGRCLVLLGWDWF